MVIHQLFPEPVYVSKLERTLTKKELEIVNEYKKKTYKNEGNLTSLDTYVLENETLKNLKKDLHTKVMYYFDKVICTDNLITPYITQSWINYTETNQFHHNHFHSNSYVSGVFYVNADKEKDQIKFFKPDYCQKIQLDVIKYNPFNSTGWRCSVQTGDVLLFPSNLIHGVTDKKGTNTRISLSFNVFFKGTIGNKKQLSELILK